MATSIVPALTDAVFTRATALLTSVSVYDGFGVSDSAGDFLMVGVDNPDPNSAGASATSNQEQIGMGPSGTVYRETGTLTCAAYSFNGDAIQKSARDVVFGIRDAIDSEIRTNRVTGATPSVLGVAGVINAHLSSLSLEQDVWQTADALLVFTINFDAVI